MLYTSSIAFIAQEMKFFRFSHWLSLLGVCALAFVFVPRSFATSTTPQLIVYNGHLLDVSGNAITTSHTVRFSLWSSADFVDADVTGTGAIQTGAATYAGWKEAFTVTPDARGYFTVTLGSTTALPDFSTLSPNILVHLHLQIEVKASGDDATAYELLDVDASSDTADRAPLQSVPNALNADLLDQRHVGTGSGAIPVLGSGGLLDLSRIPGGTDQETFTLDADDSAAAGAITLKFGEAVGATLSYDIDAGMFEMNHGLEVQGPLTVSNGGGLSVSGAILTNGNLTLNSDNEAADVSLTFGHSAGSETLKFLHAEQRFEFSDDLSVTGQLTASGGLAVDGAAVLNDDVTVGGSLTVTGLINGVDITQITSSVDNSHLKVSSGAGLSVTVARGDYRLGGNVIQYGGSTVAVPDDSTSYVYFTSTGVTVSTIGFPTDMMNIPVATVQTSGGAVTSIVDRRIFNSDDTERTVMRTFEPMYEGAAFEGDGTENVGQLIVDHSGSTLRNFYQWMSTRGTLQDYDILLRVALPADFVRWGAAPITLDYRSASPDSNLNQADVTVYDTAGDTVTLLGDSAADLAGTDWTTATWTFAVVPTWTAGGELVVRIRLSSQNGSPMQVGRLKLQYVEVVSE